MHQKYFYAVQLLVAVYSSHNSHCWRDVHLLVDRADTGGLWTVPILGEPRYKEKPPAPFLSFLEILGSPVSSPVLSPDLWDLWTCSILCSWKSPSSVNLGQILVSTFYHLIQFFHHLPFHPFLLLHLLPLLHLPLSSTPWRTKERTGQWLLVRPLCHELPNGKRTAAPYWRNTKHNAQLLMDLQMLYLQICRYTSTSSKHASVYYIVSVSMPYLNFTKFIEY